MSSQFLHNRGKTKNMVGTKEMREHYVTESAPKAVMLPVHIKGSAITKVGKFIKNKINLRSENVLYAKARSKSAGSVVQDASNYTSEHGDNELPPIQGREHIRVQTDVYLEELCGLIEEVDEQCQTDPLLDRPASPLFVPASSGTDVETQIWPGDLFDFDREVQPLLECVVGETLEQSLIEISAEEKLCNLEDQQTEFEIRRNAEKAECLRLEEEERRLLEEKQRRLKEQDEAILLEEETTQKVAACVFAQNYLTDLLPKVYKRLERQGYFVSQDTEIQEIEEDFWPWLIDEVDNEIATLEKSCHLLDSLLQDAVQNVTETAVIRPVTPTQYPERSVAEVESQVAEDEITQDEEEVPQEPSSEEP